VGAPSVVGPRSLSLTAGVCVLALLVPATSVAHHSIPAGFDPQQTIELEGELTAIRWQNPHILLTFVVTDGDGRKVSWELESLSANGLARWGISSSLLTIGDRIKVAGFPGRRGVDRIWATNLLLPSQQEILFAGPPGRSGRWSERVLRGTEAGQTDEGTAANVELGVFRVWSSGRNFLTRLPGVQNRSDPLSFPLTPEGRTAVEQRQAPEDTVGCVPKNMPWIMTQPYPIEFLRDGDTVVLKVEEYDTVRTIHLAAVAESSERTPLGHSVGRWEGSALVVTTTHATVRPFGSIGGGMIPLSDDATFVERFTPSADGAYLDYSLAITDSKYVSATVTLEKRWVNVPGTELLPYNCVE
jgi:hypothetical protein